MPHRLKILTVTESLQLGGDEMRLLHFARGLDRSRWDHTIVSLTGPDPANDARDGPISQLFAEAGVKVRHLGGPRRRFASDGRRSDLATLAGGLGSAPSTLWRLTRLIRAERPDVLDLRKHYAILWGALAGRLCRTPAVVGTDYHPQMLDAPLRRVAAGIAFGCLDAFVSDARCTISGYCARLPSLGSRAHVIPNGIRQPEPAMSRWAMLLRLGFNPPPGAVVVGQIAKFAPFKGQLVFLDAARRVLDARPGRAAFLLCGYTRNPEHREAVLAHRQRLGLTEQVAVTSYPGPSDDIWAAIDIHAHPSLMDSSPIALHESMALGLPAVATCVGGTPELVRHEKTGLLVAPGDAEGLARAIIRLLDEPALADDLGQAAKHRYQAAHTPEVMVARTLALFRQLVGRHRTCAPPHGPVSETPS